MRVNEKEKCQEQRQGAGGWVKREINEGPIEDEYGEDPAPQCMLHLLWPLLGTNKKGIIVPDSPTDEMTYPPVFPALLSNLVDIWTPHLSSSTLPREMGYWGSLANFKCSLSPNFMLTSHLTPLHTYRK